MNIFWFEIIKWLLSQSQYFYTNMKLYYKKVLFEGSLSESFQDGE